MLLKQTYLKKELQTILILAQYLQISPSSLTRYCHFERFSSTQYFLLHILTPMAA